MIELPGFDMRITSNAKKRKKEEQQKTTTNRKKGYIIWCNVVCK